MTLSDRLARLDLSRIVLGAAFAELVLDRIVPAVATRRLPAVYEAIATFTRHFSGVLCVFVLALAIGLTLNRRDLFAPPSRVLFAIIGILLVPLLGWATVAPVPSWLQTQVEVSFVFLALACVYASMRAGGDARTSAGMALLILPLLARGYAQAAASYESLAFGRLDAPRMAEHLGEAAALIAGIASPLMLPPRGEARRMTSRAAVASAFVLTATVAILAATQLSELQNAAAALGFQLPDEAAGRLVYLAALFGTLWTVVAMLPSRGSGRLVGCGLALIAVSGYTAPMRPSELSATALGLVLVLWGEAGAEKLEPLPSALPFDAEQWLAEARALAQRLGGECVMVNDEERQITRIGGKQGDHPLVLRIVRESGFDSIEVVVGSPSPESVKGDTPIPEAAREKVAAIGGNVQLWSGRGVRWRHRVRTPAKLADLERVPPLLSSLLSGR
jgi:hypothetical protein